MEEFLRVDSYINHACTFIPKIEGTLKKSNLDTTDALKRCNAAWIALLAIREPIRTYIDQARAIQDEEKEEGEDECWEEEEEDQIDRAELIEAARKILSKEYIQNIFGDTINTLFDALDVYELYGDVLEEEAA